MAIVKFTFDRNRVPANAVNLEEREEDGRPMWTWHEHVGLCLQERECNGCHDSDFFMLVWDPTKREAREILFATTRWWSYPAMASFVDATDEVRAEYEAWRRKQEREHKARSLREQRRREQEARAEAGLSYREWQRLRDALRDHDLLTRHLDLLKSDNAGRLRSEFRKSLAAQIRAWLRNEESSYSTPLSQRQMYYL